ncbi:MAG: phosphate ABC transporter ATP-binding protein PstB [Candidatus Thermoplasmatota archaeon]|nr:phosphate ABC transporter ATP-binding protein PstB [Candidatus Thermoplasmatota archaeon]
MSSKVAVRGLSLWYGKKQALYDVDLPVLDRKVTAIIGPSGCGKSTLIRCMNRMNDHIEGCRVKGSIILDGEDIYSKGSDLVSLRRRVGMVFQKPNPFPFSVYDNIAYGPRMAGIRKRSILDAIVKSSLERSALDEELGDRLDEDATELSGGQQQRLCIARALAMDPEILLMDEPCSALDPISTSKIEKLIRELSKEYCVAIVTHNMEQAARVSDHVAYMHLGKLIEYGRTAQVFKNPRSENTRNYISGKFG